MPYKIYYFDFASFEQFSFLPYLFEERIIERGALEAILHNLKGNFFF